VDNVHLEKFLRGTLVSLVASGRISTHAFLFQIRRLKDILSGIIQLLVKYLALEAKQFQINMRQL